MPTKIKLVWYFCIVITVIGFLYLSATDKMEDAMIAEEKAAKRSEARLEELKKRNASNQMIKVDPIKSIR